MSWFVAISGGIPVPNFPESALLCAGRADMTGCVYKICSRAAWGKADVHGRLAASIDDVRDGYIHLSTDVQIAETLIKPFEGQPDLVLLTLSAEVLGAALKWEASRRGELFPHLYGELTREAVLSVDDLPLQSNGCHLLPERLRQ